MDDEAAFWAAVVAAPDDDLPRLIYADWLDERGDPRGEFIRLQIELARHPADAPPADAARLRREWELIELHGEQWLGAAAEWLYYCKYRRGFPEVSLDLRAYLAGGDDLVRAAPVPVVHLFSQEFLELDDLARLAASPLAERVRSLNLGFEWVRDAGCQVLAESPHLFRLEGIDLTTNGISDLGATALAETPALAKLRLVVLSNNLLTDAAARAFASSPHSDRLHLLDLASNDIRSEGASALAASPYLDGLTVLKLHGNRFNGRSRAAKALRRRFGPVVSWR